MSWKAKDYVRAIAAYGVINQMDRVGKEQASLTEEQINARETVYPEFDWSRIFFYAFLSFMMLGLFHEYTLGVLAKGFGDNSYYIGWAIYLTIIFFDGMKDIIRLFMLGWVDDLARFRRVMWWTTATIGRAWVYLCFPMLFLH